MKTQRMVGLVLIAGFILVVVASLLGPIEVYTALDNATRLQIIAGKRGGWLFSNMLWAAATIVTAADYLLLTMSLRESARLWLLYAVVIVFLVGAGAWAGYPIQRVINPAGYLYATPPPLMRLVFVVATIIGLSRDEVIFLTSDFPSWPRYQLLAGNRLLVIGFIIFFEAMYRSFPPGLSQSRELAISPKTVRNHVSNILSKLQVVDRAKAIH